jgi:hypothetical protein
VSLADIEKDQCGSFEGGGGDGWLEVRITLRCLILVALSAFLVGLDIYLYELATASRVPEYASGLKGKLVFYWVSSLSGMATFYIAQGIKSMDDVWLKRWRVSETTSIPKRRK